MSSMFLSGQADAFRALLGKLTTVEQVQAVRAFAATAPDWDRNWILKACEDRAKVLERQSYELFIGILGEELSVTPIDRARLCSVIGEATLKGAEILCKGVPDKIEVHLVTKLVASQMADQGSKSVT